MIDHLHCTYCGRVIASSAIGTLRVFKGERGETLYICPKCLPIHEAWRGKQREKLSGLTAG